MPVKRAILIVGVEQYADQKIQRLRCVYNDRQELFGFFKYRAGYDEVHSLAGERSEDVIDKAEEMARGLSPGDLFVFYFCGHGCAQASRYLMLCADARLEDLSALRQVVPLDHLQKKTARPGVDRVFILDACRRELDDAGLPSEGTRSLGGGGFQGVETFRQVMRDISIIPKPAAPSANLAILSSCEDGKQAAEVQSLNHGIFTAAMLGLMGDASKAGQAVTITEGMRGDLINRMHALAARHGLPAQQFPSLQCEGPSSALLLGGKDPRGGEESPDGYDSLIGWATDVASPPTVLSPAEAVAEPIVEPPVEPIALPFELPTGGKISGKPVRHTEAWFPMTVDEATDVQAAAAARLRVPAEVHVQLTDDVRLTFRLIPAGHFMMGSPPDEAGRFGDESRHSVTLTRPFFLQTSVVTQGQWAAVTGSYPPNFEAASKPMIVSTLGEVGQFLQWPRARHRGLRLPTEAEWEYACRAGAAGQFGGVGGPDVMGWHAGNSQGRVHSTRGRNANAWGLFDMHGNLLEWCADAYGPYPSHPVKDPTGPSRGAWSVRDLAGQLWTGTKRVARGGAFDSSLADCRCARRHAVIPVNRGRPMGLRLAWSFDKEKVFGPLGIAESGKQRRLI